MALERLRLDGKVAIVTGGAKGVGRGIAETLAEAGAAVVIMSRTQADVDAAVARITDAGGRAIGIAGDVLREADQARLVEAAVDGFGRVDILVNNTGGAAPTPWAQVTAEKFLQDFQFNVVSALQVTQRAAPHLAKSGAGAIVNISSRAAQISGPGFLTYSVAKAGLEQMTRVLARDLAPAIRVNAIALGMILTDALEGYLDTRDGARERVLPQIPLHRIGNVEDIGLATLYLCSSGSYMTGHVLHIDGGIDRSPSLA